MSDIFDEVAEDLRAERMKQLFVRYGGVLIAVLVLVILGVAGWKAIGWYQGRETARLATLYLAASEAARPPPSGAGDVSQRKKEIPAFEKIIAEAGGPGWAGGWLANDGYRTLARLQLAALQWDTGSHKAALALWDTVAADAAADPVLRDTARLQWVLHQLDSGEVAGLKAHLAPLQDPANPLHALAEEAQALLSLREGKTKDARATLKRLSADVMAPSGVRARAAGVLAQIGGDAP